MSANAAIFHHPDAIESAEQPLAGRRTAGQSFLGGLIRHLKAETLHAFAHQQGHLDQFRALAEGHGWTGPVEMALAHDVDRMGAPGTIMVPGPNLASFAWVRRRAQQDKYSICGITHTVSTKRIMQGLAEGAAAPIESWDAIICTSRAVRGAVKAEMDLLEDYLTQRFMAARVPRPQLPVIPLGIDTARFGRDDAARARWRGELGLDDDTIAIMSMGRLTVAEKMHPAPLMQAAQRAAEQTGRKVALWMVGWFGNDAARDMHQDMAAAFAPDVDVRFPDGKDPDLRFEIWSAADIFALPVDNIQETYGLAPVEAMAAGLPVVCSDWDGFRDTVDHGVTGFRIPTRFARPGAGIDVARRYEDGRDDYHQYLVCTHQRTAVDVRAMADAFVTLIRDPDKRAEMGRAGIARARSTYDWSVIIPQYQALWAELGERRVAEVATSPRSPGAPANPAAADPFLLYAGYPAQSLRGDSVLTTEHPVDAARIEDLVSLTGAKQFRRIVGRAEELADVQRAVHTLGPVRYQDLLARSKGNLYRTESCVLWLLKFDLIQVADPGAS